MKLSPDITWVDIYNYLINTPSLEAYNFFVSVHVHDVAYHGIKNLSELCFIKTKVIIKGLSFFTSQHTFRIFGVFCFNVSQLYYTLLVTYFVFIPTCSYTAFDETGRVNSCVF